MHYYYLILDYAMLLPRNAYYHLVCLSLSINETLFSTR